MGTHLRVLGKSYPKNTNIIWQGLDGSQKSLHPCAFDKINFSIGKVGNVIPL